MMTFLRKLFGRKPDTMVMYGEPGQGESRLVSLEDPTHLGIVFPPKPEPESYSIERRVAWMRKHQLKLQIFEDKEAEQPTFTLHAGAHHRLGRIVVVDAGFRLDLSAEGQYVENYDVYPTLEEAADDLIDLLTSLDR